MYKKYRNITFRHLDISTFRRHGLYLCSILISQCLYVPFVTSSSALAREKLSRPKMLNEIYTDYKPVFEYAQPPNLIKLSRQPGFYNRAKIMQDSRVPALIEAAKKREAEKDYREAIKHYQKIIQKFPESLIRVSDFGVYVPAVLYVQHRMLTYPSIELKHYRTLFDAEAKDVYERAKAGHSLEGLHDVADFFLATSYGAKALVDLGKHALDVGHFEAAVHYFEEIRLRHPRSDYNIEELSFNLAYAYKRLGHVKDYQKMVAGIRSGGNDRLGLLNKLKPLRSVPGPGYPA